MRFLFLIFCFRGNDGLEVTRNLKKTETERSGFPPARE
ncbi:hypothetical protein [Neisseria meningitidis serogroup B]|uniref:PilS cassette n=1 Tax=Neisseria meningitidis serogroup B TaxID=491 RepID=A0A0H5QDW3_NEIMI|nr:hypothetical protein [Neisseria meningitidis serogroup B]